MGPVFRAPMRARDHDAPPGAGAEHRLEHGVVAIGDTDERRIARFGAAPEGAFVWTRDTAGAYWLGRITGPRRDAPANDAGLTHTRAADWRDAPVPDDEVPAGVLATFARGGRNFQRTHAEAVERRTAALWAASGG